MFRFFLLACKRYARLWWLGILPRPGANYSLRRAAVMLLFLPLLGILLAVHWLGFMLDELFFRGYRKLRIEEPVFILGVPRSGTSHLHAVMVTDEQFTSFTLWECLFGLSITARYFWRGVGRVDRLCGGPLHTLVAWVERRWFSSLNDVHPITLNAPEEDYLALLPLLACFILVVPFPAAPWLWRMGYFDRDMSPREKSAVLRFYLTCLQRHLYFHGAHKRILSKNAAFASLAQALIEFFPDSRVICCERDPTETLPSQLSALSGSIRFFDADAEFFSRRFLELFEHYYVHLDETLDRLPRDRAVRVPIDRQRDALTDTISEIYARLGLPMSDNYLQNVEELAQRSREYRSRHRYSAGDFGFSQSFLRERFGDRW